MVLNAISDLKVNQQPLKLEKCEIPRADAHEVLIRITACGVCHTELDEIEGRTPPPALPVIPGHQVVGIVTAKGPKAARHQIGDRLGVAWIHSACGQCRFCASGQDNLCAAFQATGRDVHGGYAEYMKVGEDYAFPIPDTFADVEAAPLLCAGAIGYRSLRLTQIEDGQNLGLTGFGASAHLVLKMVRHKYPQAKVYVFARSEPERKFAMELGAVWSGHTDAAPPAKLHAIIDTTPAWKPIVTALANLEKGGRLVINAIRKEPADKEILLKLSYAEHLWLEKEIKSVANVASRDVAEFLELAAAIPLRPEVQTYELEDANRALMELKQRKIRGAKVLVV
jgi:propanol-preferring alcohol dehydrogenase